MSQVTLDAMVKARVRPRGPVFTVVAADVVFQFGGSRP